LKRSLVVPNHVYASILDAVSGRKCLIHAACGKCPSIPKLILATLCEHDVVFHIEEFEIVIERNEEVNRLLDPIITIHQRRVIPFPAFSSPWLRVLSP
jgi:hypothetical protein